MRGENDPDHGSVWTSTDSTAGRSRTIGVQLPPESGEACALLCMAIAAYYVDDFGNAVLWARQACGIDLAAIPGDMARDCMSAAREN